MKFEIRKRYFKNTVILSFYYNNSFLFKLIEYQIDVDNSNLMYLNKPQSKYQFSFIKENEPVFFDVLPNYFYGGVGKFQYFNSLLNYVVYHNSNHKEENHLYLDKEFTILFNHYVNTFMNQLVTKASISFNIFDIKLEEEPKYINEKFSFYMKNGMILFEYMNDKEILCKLFNIEKDNLTNFNEEFYNVKIDSLNRHTNPFFNYYINYPLFKVRETKENTKKYQLLESYILKNI